jgi:hypothetical protein|tara:strand:+ start:306 stop:521 length:216 start_codon:yes stop_codon:yes gene_type:complete
MGCFFYKTFEELLEFAQQEGFDETLPDTDSGDVANISEKNIKEFLLSKGLGAQSIYEAMRSSGLLREKEVK